MLRYYKVKDSDRTTLIIKKLKTSNIKYIQIITNNFSREIIKSHVRFDFNWLKKEKEKPLFINQRFLFKTIEYIEKKCVVLP